MKYNFQPSSQKRKQLPTAEEAGLYYDYAIMSMEIGFGALKRYGGGMESCSVLLINLEGES